MRIVISGIPIDIQKKNIKNMHLQIKPPDGHVVMNKVSPAFSKAADPKDSAFGRFPQKANCAAPPRAFIQTVNYCERHLDG